MKIPAMLEQLGLSLTGCINGTNKPHKKGCAGHADRDVWEQADEHSILRHQQQSKGGGRKQQQLTDQLQHQLQYQQGKTVNQHRNGMVSCKTEHGSQVPRDHTSAAGEQGPSCSAEHPVPGWQLQAYQQPAQDTQQQQAVPPQAPQQQQQQEEEEVSLSVDGVHPTLPQPQMQTQSQQEKPRQMPHFLQDPWQHAYNHPVMRELKERAEDVVTVEKGLVPWPPASLAATAECPRHLYSTAASAAAHSFMGAAFLVSSYNGSKQELVTFWQYQLQPSWLALCQKGKQAQRWQRQQQQQLQQDTAALCDMLALEKGTRVVQHADGPVSFEVPPQQGACAPHLASVPQAGQVQGSSPCQDQLRRSRVAQWVQEQQPLGGITAAAAAAEAAERRALAVQEALQLEAVKQLRQQKKRNMEEEEQKNIDWSLDGAGVRQLVEWKRKQCQLRVAKEQWENRQEVQLLEIGWVPFTFQDVKKQVKQELGVKHRVHATLPYTVQHPTLSQLLQLRQDLPTKQLMHRQMAREREREQQTVLVWEPHFGAANIKRLLLRDCNIE